MPTVAKSSRKKDEALGEHQHPQRKRARPADQMTLSTEQVLLLLEHAKCSGLRELLTTHRAVFGGDFTLELTVDPSASEPASTAIGGNVPCAEAAPLLQLIAQQKESDTLARIDRLHAAVKEKKRVHLLQSALHLACAEGDMEIAQALVERENKLLNKTDSGRRTPLHIATMQGRAEIVSLLLKSKAEVNVVDELRMSPLLYAAQNGFQKCASLLLEAKADITAKDKSDSTALHLAALHGHKDVAVTLVNETTGGGLVNEANEYGRTALHCAAFNGHTAIVDILLDRNSDIDAQNKNGLTALHWAANNCHHDTVELLLSRGASMDIRTHYEKTALHVAAVGNHARVLSLLVDHDADCIEAEDENGCTALSLAVQQAKTQSIRQLVELGADLSSTIDNVRQSSQHYPDCPDIDLGILQYLTSLGADLEMRDQYDMTPLQHACLKGNSETINFLLKNGADIHSFDEKANTPLHHAVSKKHVAIVRGLLSRGADPHKK